MTDIPAADRIVTSSDNNPPAIIAHTANIEDLFTEAGHWLDGSGVKTEADAEGVAKLLVALRDARKAADDQRKAEKKPHDDAVKAVQEAWNPLLAKCDLAVDAAKKALTPYQIAKDDAQRAEADAARELAVQQQKAAQEALQASSGDDLAARENAEVLLKAANKASKAADRLDKQTAKVASGGRAVGLRTSYRAEITDFTLFARWAWASRRAEYEAFLNDLAEREGRRGPVEIPGLIVHTERNSA